MFIVLFSGVHEMGQSLEQFTLDCGGDYYSIAVDGTANKNNNFLIISLTCTFCISNLIFLKVLLSNMDQMG